jgi:DNA-binding transcriptional LysR family regulator
MNGKGGIPVHFDYLRAFCVVVRAKSITKAAKELHLSQPALSQQINSLENKFRTKLLERSNRGVTVTRTGAKVYQYGMRMLSIMEALEQEIRNIQEPGSLRVSIAASPIPGNYLMPIKMLYFISDHPRLRYSLVIKPVEEVIDSVVDRTTNLGIVSGPISPQTMNRLSSEQIALYLLGHDEIVAICGKGSPWSQEKYQVADLRALPIIVPNQQSGTRIAIEHCIQDTNMSLDKLNIVMEMDNSIAVTSAVKAGAGIGLIPRLAANDPGIEILDLPGLSIPLPFYLLVSIKLSNNPLVKKLIAFLETGFLTTDIRGTAK